MLNEDHGERSPLLARQVPLYRCSSKRIGRDSHVAMQVLATVGLTVPRHLRASDYETFFRRAGLVEGRRPRKIQEICLICGVASRSPLRLRRNSSCRPCACAPQHLLHIPQCVQSRVLHCVLRKVCRHPACAWGAGVADSPAAAPLGAARAAGGAAPRHRSAASRPGSR